MNKVILIGHCGADPDMRSTASGKSVANVSLATSERWNNSAGERQERTTWHRLVAWDPVANIFERFVRKGSRIAVEGKIQVREWDGEDGKKRYSNEILVERLELLDSAPSQGAGSERPRQAPQSPARQAGTPPKPATPQGADPGYFDDDVQF